MHRTGMRPRCCSKLSPARYVKEGIAGTIPYARGRQPRDGIRSFPRPERRPVLPGPYLHPGPGPHNGRRIMMTSLSGKKYLLSSGSTMPAGDPGVRP